jgi:predicted S18 family serine protease
MGNSESLGEEEIKEILKTDQQINESIQMVLNHHDKMLIKLYKRLEKQQHETDETKKQNEAYDIVQELNYIKSENTLKVRSKTRESDFLGLVKFFTNKSNPKWCL